MKKIFIWLIVAVIFIAPVIAAEKPKGINKKGPLTKVTFIHYKKDFAKPPWAGGGKDKDSSSKCYSFLAKGAKWKTIENYEINPSNNDRLSKNEVVAAVVASASTWNDHTNVFGVGKLNTTISYSDEYDEINSVSFGNYYDPGVIAVTNVWGYFGGPPRTRELVEWDMLLDTDFEWGNAYTTASVMDLQNIITHELGHAVGLGHPESTCVEETMYAYSDYGETKKRDLYDGDKAGIRELYK